MSFEEFQDGHIGGQGGHLGYRNRTILAILNICVTVMPLTKIQCFWQYIAAILPQKILLQYHRNPFWQYCGNIAAILDFVCKLVSCNIARNNPFWQCYQNFRQYCGNTARTMFWQYCDKIAAILPEVLAILDYEVSICSLTPPAMAISIGRTTKVY